MLDASGEVLVVGHKDKSGVFFDAETGVPFARELGGALVFDGAATAPVRDEDKAAAMPGAEADEDQPKLCPDPGADQPGSDYSHRLAKAWMTYVPPVHVLSVDLVGIPFSERTPDGGLLVSATEEIFRADSSTHVEGARRISQACQPLNTTLPK